MLRIVTHRSPDRIERYGPSFGVAATDDFRPPLLVGRKFRQCRCLRVGVGALCFLELSADRVEFCSKESF